MAQHSNKETEYKIPAINIYINKSEEKEESPLFLMFKKFMAEMPVYRMQAKLNKGVQRQKMDSALVQLLSQTRKIKDRLKFMPTGELKGGG